VQASAILGPEELRASETFSSEILEKYSRSSIAQFSVIASSTAFDNDHSFTFSRLDFEALSIALLYDLEQPKRARHIVAYRSRFSASTVFSLSSR
jgi:hypothetical protein